MTGQDVAEIKASRLTMSQSGGQVERLVIFLGKYRDALFHGPVF